MDMGSDAYRCVVLACPEGERFVHRLVCRAWSEVAPARPTADGIASSRARLEVAQSCDIRMLRHNVAVAAARAGCGEVVHLCGRLGPSIDAEVVAAAIDSARWALVAQLVDVGYQPSAQSNVALRYCGRGELARGTPDWAELVRGVEVRVVPDRAGDAKEEQVSAVFRQVLGFPDACVCVDATHRSTRTWREGDEWIAQLFIGQSWDGVGNFRPIGGPRTVELVVNGRAIPVTDDVVVPTRAVWAVHVHIEMRFDVKPAEWGVTSTLWALPRRLRDMSKRTDMTLGPLLVRDGLAGDACNVGRWCKGPYRVSSMDVLAWP
jgi:hypothetical protein